VRDYLDEILQDKTRAVASSFRPAPAEAIRARGDQRGRRQAAGLTLLTCAVLVAGGGAAYATIGRPTAPPPVTRSASPAVSPSFARSVVPSRPGGEVHTPAYLVTAGGGTARVQVSATGRVVATMRLPASFYAVEGVAAAPGDQTFYLAGASATGVAPGRAKIVFFRVTLGAGGRPGALRRLPGAPYLTPFPISSNGQDTIPLAVSPDGRQLAYSSGIAATPHSASQSLVVQDVATGTRRTWRSWPSSLTQVTSVSWAPGGQLGFAGSVGDAAVSNGTVIRRAGRGLDVLMVLNTAASGSSLTGSSHLIAYGPVSAEGDAGPSGVVMSQDGGTAYTWMVPQRGASALVAISVATGQITRVLAINPKARPGGLQQANPAAMSIDGTSLLFPLTLPHTPHPASGALYVIGHLAAASVTTGHIATLPFPLRDSAAAPVPPVDAAW
jgi:hypothetical protein